MVCLDVSKICKVTLQSKKKKMQKLILKVSHYFWEVMNRFFLSIFSWCVLWTLWMSSTAWWRASSAAAALPPARTRLAGHLGWAYFQWPRSCAPAWAQRTSSCATVAFIGEWRQHHHPRHSLPVKSLDPSSLSLSIFTTFSENENKYMEFKGCVKTFDCWFIDSTFLYLMPFHLSHVSLRSPLSSIENSSAPSPEGFSINTHLTPHTH